MKETNLTRDHSLAIGRGWVDPASSQAVSPLPVEMENGGATALIEGDVVVVKSDGTVIKTTTVGDQRPTGVALDDIDPGDSGMILFWGPVDLVNVTASVTAGDFGQTSASGGLAQTAAAIGDAFVFFTDTGTTPSGFLWGGRGGGLSAGSNTAVGSNSVIGITYVIDGGGSTITTGIKGDLQIPFAATITEWTILLDQSGSIVVDIWKDTYGNYAPTDADSITASATPTVSSATKATSATLTGWTTSIAAGDTLRFNVDSITSATRATVVLKCTREGGGGGGSGDVATDTIWDAPGDLVQGTGANTAAKLTLGAAGTVVRSTGSTNAYAFPPGYELDYVEITSPVTIASTSEGSPTTIITGSSVAYDGSTTVMIEFFSPVVDSDTAGAITVITLFDGSTDLGRLAQVRTAISTDRRTPVFAARRLTPSNASHTYSIRAWASSASTQQVGAGSGGSGSQLPAFIRITKV